MKVLYDYQIFEMQKFGGISRIFYELMSHFGRSNSVQWKLPIRYSENEYLNTLPYFEGKLSSKPVQVDPLKNFLGDKSFRGKRILYQLKNRVLPLSRQENFTDFNKQLSIKELQKGEFDIFHPTYYDPYFLEYIGDKPFVITVYDLIHQVFPEFFMDISYPDKNATMLQRATKILAISESTKKDLVNIFGIDEKKIIVTYLANSLRESSEISQQKDILKLPDQYILCVGHRNIYKNFYFFIQAITPLLKTKPDLFVVCTGIQFNEDEKRYLAKLGISEKVLHCYVDDRQLANLYHRALVFAFPSLYEGFGLPILEAFSCSCPVITSNSSSLPEVGGDAVVYFEPKNARSILDALTSIVDNIDLRQKKINKGYEQLKRFSWQKTALETESVYAQVLSQKLMMSD